MLQEAAQLNMRGLLWQPTQLMLHRGEKKKRKKRRKKKKKTDTFAQAQQDEEIKIISAPCPH